MSRLCDCFDQQHMEEVVLGQYQGPGHEIPAASTYCLLEPSHHAVRKPTCLFLSLFFFLKEHLFIYLLIYLLAVLGLRCCTWAFSSCGEQGLLFAEVHGLLIEVASLVAEHGL